MLRPSPLALPGEVCKGTSMSLLAITYPMIDPIAIQIGPFAIRWYALAYIVGLLIGWRLVLWHIGRVSGPPMQRNDADDFLVWAIVAVILGGRVGYILFYNPGFYLQNPIEVLYLWHGGMSFHGGLIGVILALVLFCHKRQLALLPVGDLIASVAPVGLFFGRLANFINAELWGRPSDVPWAMVFPGACLREAVTNLCVRDPATGGILNPPRHPSQLYEAFLEGFVLLALLQWLYRQESVRRRPGVVGGVFLLSYGLIRISVEMFREPDGQIGHLLAGTTLGQWLSVPLLIAGFALVMRGRSRAA